MMPRQDRDIQHPFLNQPISFPNHLEDIAHEDLVAALLAAQLQKAGAPVAAQRQARGVVEVVHVQVLAVTAADVR
jgi:hypothetical protein